MTHDNPPQASRSLRRRAGLTAFRRLLMLALTPLLAACAQDALRHAPASPDQPWQASSSVWRRDADAAREASAAPDSASTQGFGIPRIPDLPALTVDAQLETHAELSLAQLIDLAQRSNPDTRQAWNRAREAALSVGLAEALFLPLISAHVIHGHQRIDVPVGLPDGSRSTLRTRVNSTVPILALNWLLFDFGERSALREEAGYAALGANVLFNATHQKIIRDVTDHYYQFDAARTRTALAREALSNHRRVEQAAQARFSGGVATRVDVALAQQATAQGKLHLVNSEGLEHNAYLALLGAIGLPPSARLSVARSARVDLPSAVDPLTAQRINDALSRRPDVAAAYVALRASEAGERAARAAFMPKVYLGASLARNRTNISLGGLPSASPLADATGVLLGMSVPLYDGGMRSHQLGKARIRREQSAENLRKLLLTALREVAAAEATLRSALQSHEASLSLVETAEIAYDAALESYRAGLSSLLTLTEASTQLNKARQALSDANYASLTSAANLAFLMGDMVAPRADWLPSQGSRR